ncbi:MAG: 16S rRNA (cytosine(967)-C(5))-methyltransferase RsmB [Kiritimatiellae bacterium]|nr:16S rRNA (cytosine(967)-C(5))-methyltransferase RsmB [Kiritimatiellia bacterium]
MKKNSRAVAASIISEWLDTADFPDRLIEDIVDDRAFVMEMVYGVIRNYRTLEWMVTCCSDRRPDCETMALVLVGLYQIFILDDVAEYAAVNETVNAASQCSERKAGGFVNAVLRRSLREKEDILKRLSAQELGIRESHPSVLVDRWKSEFGDERTVALCRWNNSRPMVTIHPNSMQTTVSQYLKLLQAEGIDAKCCEGAEDEFLVLPRGVRVNSLPGFSDGMFSVHDPSTAVAVNLLDLHGGESVLDACAAPGGKTILMAQKMKGSGTITAMDLYEDRLVRLHDNVKRMKLSNVDVIQGNTARHIPGGPYDRILLDVPCTNTGVLRKRPDARWRFSLKRLQEITTLQQRILDHAASVLHSDGKMVYSTCSLEPEECAKLIESWLETRTDMTLVESVFSFPTDTKMDGGYAAVMKFV